jgi:hypothetical protein
MVPPIGPDMLEVPSTAPRVEFILPGWIHGRWWLPGGQPQSMNFIVVPTTPGRCRVEFLVLNLAPGAPKISWTDHAEIMAQDAAAAEAIQPAYDIEGEDFERSVESDAPPLLLRKIMRLAAAGQWSASALAGTKSRIFTYRDPGRAP